MSDTVTALRATRELLTDEARWCQGALARDRSGKPVFIVYDPAACRFCLTGALRLVTKDAEASLYFRALEILDRALQGDWDAPRFFKFHDHPDTTHADVLRLLDAAIAEAEKKEHS